MQTLRLILTFLFITLTVSCGTLGSLRSDSFKQAAPAPYPVMRLAVFSDPHLHSSSLGMTGKDFWENVNEGKKLLHLSNEILDTLVDALCHDQSLDFVLIPGDLTKDGEYENHLAMRARLEKLKAAGIAVYVVPGNHDVMNYDARRYSANGSEPARSVSAQEFKNMYAEFGYAEAIASDPHSLSYVAEPVPGLWLFGLDSCTYRLNSPKNPSSTYGEFSAGTLAWLEEMLLQARAKNKAAIGFMHHNILEHFSSQKKYFKNYVINNYETVARLCASYGMRFVFTGHFHAHDVTMKRYTEDAFLFDVETSSLVTYPCAYRLVAFQASGTALFTTRRISSLASMPYFSHYALMTLWIGVSNFLESYFVKYNFSPEERRLLIPQLVKGLVAHASGDESPPNVLIDTHGLSIGLAIIVAVANDLIEGAWHDLPPADNDISIDSRSGEWAPLANQ